MSIKWMYAELAEAKLDGTALLLLLDLSLHADEASVCWSTVGRLAEYCGLTQRRVRRILRALHQHGYITLIDPGDATLEIRVNCLQMLQGNPEVDGLPVLNAVRQASDAPYPSLSHSPNWN